MEQTHQPHQWHQPHEAHNSHHTPYFNEEEALDKVEQRLDHTMEKIMNKGFVSKFLNIKIIKDIIHSHFVHEANHKISSFLSVTFTVIGRISLVAWILGIFSFLVSLSGLGFMFSLGFGIGLRVLIYILLALLFAFLSLFMWIGMLRFKKRVLSLVILGFAVSALSFVISLVPVGLYSYRSYGSFWGSLFNLLITFVLVVLVVKNEHMFKN